MQVADSKFANVGGPWQAQAYNGGSWGRGLVGAPWSWKPFVSGQCVVAGHSTHAC